MVTENTPRKIAASDALAAAVSGQGKPSRKEEQVGIPLKPHQDAFDVDTPRATEPQQLQVSPITHVKSEYREQVLHQIVSNTSYICYGLKEGHIRVLNKETANRALLKGHTAMIMDMRFFCATSNLLASSDQAGTVFVRKIYEESAEASIQEEVLVSHKFDFSDLATRHLAWHPQMENLLAVLTKDRIAFVNVPPTSGLASTPDFAQPILPEAPAFDGAPNKMFTSLAFSFQGDLLAAGTSDGTVGVWALPPDFASKEQVEPLPDKPQLSFAAFGGEQGGEAAACSLDFLPSHENHSVLVVANPTANRLELWVVSHPEGGSMSAECTYKLELQSSRQGPAAFFNHLLVQPNFSVVILANTKRKQVYVLHAHQDASSSHAAFDHLCLFEVQQPILSMSTLTEPGYEQGSPVQELHLYCVQTKAIQQYTLHPGSCFPAADLEEDRQRQSEPEVEAKPPLPPRPPAVPPTVHTTIAPLSPEPPSPAPSPAPEAAEVATPAEAATAAATPPSPPPTTAAATSRVKGRTTEEMQADMLAKKRQVEAAAAAAACTVQGEGVSAQEEESDEDLRRVQEAGSKAQAAQQPKEEAQQQLQQQQEEEQQKQKQQEAVSTSSTATAGAEAVDGLMRVSKSPSSKYPSSASKRPRIEDSEEDNGTSHLQAGPRGGDSSSSCSSSSAPATTTSATTTISAPPIPKSLLLCKGQPGVESPSQASTAADSKAQVGPGSSQQGPGHTVGTKPTAAAAGSKLYEAGDIDRILAAQQQALTQLMNSHKESLKTLRAEHKAELDAQAKVHESAVKAAVESSLKAAEQREHEYVRGWGGRDVGLKVDQLGRQLPNQVAASIRSALAQALPSVAQQAVDNALNAQLHSTLPKVVSDAVRDNFASSVVPAFEKATQVIFGQMEAAIKQSVDIHTSPATKATALLEHAHTQMGVLISCLHTEAGSLRTEMAAMRTESAAASRSATAAGAAAAKAAAAATAASKVVSQGAIAPSAAPPLALQAPVDPKVAINDLLAHNRFDEAFSMALESGAAMLDWLIHKVQPQAVLDADPCPLSPGVLLSMLTHLAHGVRTEPELKLKWIIEVAPCLDPKHPQAAPHTRRVLEPVKAQLQSLARDAPGDTGRSAKTAVHLINSLLHQ